MDPSLVWEGRGVGAHAVRALLMPAGWLFRVGVTVRNTLFDVGVLPAHPTSIPAFSVGNLTVGGTGKTPIAADIARRLHDAGARPALALRGYGDDEPAVHELLNPDVPVLTDPDRVAASARARQLGCDVVVLDDAFQHRRTKRVIDAVVVAAEQWEGAPRRCLPAGPYREPPSVLRRADLVIVTRKSADTAAAADVARAVEAFTSAPVVGVTLELGALHRVDGEGESRPLETLQGTSVLAVAGIGAPQRLSRQLEQHGARVDLLSFPDHHRFTGEDVAAILRRSAGVSTIICTLKDAVKLDSLWPRATFPLWYVSQRVAIDAGASAYLAAIQRLLDARQHEPFFR